MNARLPFALEIYFDAKSGSYFARSEKAKNKIPRKSGIAIGKPLGICIAFINKILTAIGNIKTTASATNLPETKAKPHNNSKILATGKTYFEAAIPSINVFVSPLNSCGGAGNKKYAMAPKINNKPTKVLTIIIAIFIL